MTNLIAAVLGPPLWLRLGLALDRFSLFLIVVLPIICWRRLGPGLDLLNPKVRRRCLDRSLHIAAMLQDGEDAKGIMGEAVIQRIVAMVGIAPPGIREDMHLCELWGFTVYLY